MEITYGDFERSQSEALTILVKDWKDQLFDFRAYFDLQQSAYLSESMFIIIKTLLLVGYKEKTF